MLKSFVLNVLVQTFLTSFHVMQLIGQRLSRLEPDRLLLARIRHRWALLQATLVLLDDDDVLWLRDRLLLRLRSRNHGEVLDAALYFDGSLHQCDLAVVRIFVD